MAGRRRPLAILLATAVAVLVLGRFGAQFITERLWEAQVSEAAALVGTRLALLVAALELAGILTAFVWFLAHFGLAARAIVLEYGDLPRPLGQLSERAVYWLVAVVAVVLAVAIGAGTGRWLSPLLLVATGVRYGVTDTLLQRDLGLFVTWLPVLELFRERALALVLPTLLGVTVLAIVGGTLRVSERRIGLAPRMRAQFAFLLATLALLAAWRLAETPFLLAATRSAAIGPAEFLLRVTVSQVELGFALAAALLTALWGFRGRFVVALGGWVGLGLALLAGTVLVESRSGGGPLGAAELAPLRRVDSIAFGIGLVRGAPAAAAPSLWDGDALARALEGDSGGAVHLVPGAMPVRPGPSRIWVAIRPRPSGEASLFIVADDRAGPTGGPLSLRPGDSTFTPGLVPYFGLGPAAVRPGALDPVIGAVPVGVALSGPVRRVALAWGLQTGAPLRAAEDQRIAWRLDPESRLARVGPFASWGRPRAHLMDGELFWLADGFLAADRFPASREVEWRGASFRMRRAAFVGVIRARTGRTWMFLRPDADSLAHAWARAAAPLIEPASAMPAGLADAVGLPAEQLAVQAQVLQGPAWIGAPVARYGRNPYPLDELPVSGAATDPVAMPFLNEAGTAVARLVTGPARPGSLAAVVVAVDSSREVSAPRELQQRWDRFPFFQQLRDSVRAAGADYRQGLIRFGLRGDTLVAYQPNFALGPGGQASVVLVNVAQGPKLGAGRSFEDAWRNLRGEIGPVPVGSDPATRLEQAREWLERADAALRRGDVEEFGRAFGFLREVLRAGRLALPPDSTG